MKYFKCVAKATGQGTEAFWKVKAEDEKEAMFLFADKAMEHIESFDNVIEIAEESGCEYEYNYYVQEIPQDVYEEAEIEDLI